MPKAPKIKALKTDNRDDSSSHKESSVKEASGKKKNKNKKDQFNPQQHSQFYSQAQQPFQPHFPIQDQFNRDPNPYLQGPNPRFMYERSFNFNHLVSRTR